MNFSSAEDRERYQRSRARRGREGDAAPAGRTLPHSIEAEEVLLSCCLLDGPEVIPSAMEAGIGTGSFYEPKHAEVFGVLLDLYAAKKPTDISVLAEEMKTRGTLDRVGGYAFLAQISEHIPTTAQAGYFIEKVREQAQLREVIRSLTSQVEAAYGFSGGIDEFAASVEADVLRATSGSRRGLPEVMGWGELIGKTERPMPEEVVKGLLYRACKMMLGGGSKSFKTWVLLDLALSVATGKPWWGMQTTAMPVLFVNFELIVPSFEKRVRSICKAKGIPLEGAGMPANFKVWHLRGHAKDFAELRMPLLNKIRRLKTGMTILDPIYKCLGERDENSNGDVGDLLNLVESVAVDGNCAMVHGHHFAKGDSSEKSKMDLTSGAGAWMRDPDTAAMLRPHEEEEHFTAEFILRDMPQKAPMVVRWRHPVMEWEPGKDPSALKKAGRPKSSDATDVTKIVSQHGPLTYSQLLYKAEKEAGMSESTFKRRLKEAIEAGKLTQCGPLYNLAGETAA